MKDYISVLQNSELFKGIESNGLLSLINCLNGKIKEYAKGEFIFNEGNKTQVSGILIKGALQICSK